MINQDTALKLQAFLDGELPSAEAQAVAELLTGNSEANALFEELRTTRSLLSGNELQFKVPESREFYWSKIARGIERQERPEAATAPRGTPWWVRFLVPVSALAALAVAVLVWRPSQRGWIGVAEGHEIETPLEETSSFTFRSESAGMTVVWVDTHRN
jgi:anti-sigma factor RsiW